VSEAPVRVPNDPSGSPGSALSEFVRLQTEFQARLAEETISYLRRLQGAAAPAAPGTVVMPDADGTLDAAAQPGGSAVLELEVENRQRVHCMVTPVLGQLVAASGVTWMPAAEATPPSLLVAPEQVVKLAVALAVPPELPPDTYRGSLVLQGFRQGGVPVAVTVEAAP
jgi:hypothetical protein